jgi:hypothetical protein
MTLSSRIYEQLETAPSHFYDTSRQAQRFMTPSRTSSKIYDNSRQAQDFFSETSSEDCTSRQAQICDMVKLEDLCTIETSSSLWQHRTSSAIYWRDKLAYLLTTRDKLAYLLTTRGQALARTMYLLTTLRVFTWQLMRQAQHDYDTSRTNSAYLWHPSRQARDLWHLERQAKICSTYLKDKLAYLLTLRQTNVFMIIRDSLAYLWHLETSSKLSTRDKIYDNSRQAQDLWNHETSSQFMTPQGWESCQRAETSSKIYDTSRQAQLWHRTSSWAAQTAGICMACLWQGTCWQLEQDMFIQTSSIYVTSETSSICHLETNSVLQYLETNNVFMIIQRQPQAFILSRQAQDLQHL